ncbi:hypothetical protein MKW98_026609 [Papaver atlanticum]|uniref:SAM domain-containing protein n=1 Tax=Papaver atlanticum TaxID=357466 RepID=A0AAD4X6J0_9MAGN|nr:hypothetical protein MKW98_026609 [Papaver atlanticum]
MEGGGSGSGTVALSLKNNNNSIKSVLARLQTKWGELEKGFQGWVCKQPLPVETVFVAATYAFQGAVAGLVFGSLAQSEAANNFLPFQNLGKTRLAQFRNFSVLRKELEEGKTIPRLAIAAFTSGYMFQLVRNIPSPEAIATGLLLAVCQGLVHEVRSNSSQLPLEDTCYTRTRCMLSSLGLQNYENNFKKNLLTDDIMPLLKESHLVSAGIPLGPRIQILNHIERDPDLLKMQAR